MKTNRVLALLPTVLAFWLLTQFLSPSFCHGDSLLLGNGESMDRESNEMIPGNISTSVVIASNENVTVTMRDGAIYRNVTIDADWDYMVLIVQSDNRSPKNLPFDSVESIIDAEGKDITQEVLGEYSSSESEHAAVNQGVGEYHGIRARRSPWTFGITVSPTYSTPFGDWYEGMEADVGGRVIASIGVSDEVSIDFGYQYQKLGIDQDYLGEVSGLVGGFETEIYIQEFDVRVDKIFVGARYLGKVRNVPLWGYGGFGAGGYIHRSSIEMEIRDPDFGSMFIDESLSETEFALTYTGGIVYMFSGNVGMDISGRFDMIFGTIEEYSDALGYMAEVSGGLVFSF